MKDDAYWAFSAARLLEVIWWSNLGNTGAERLYQAHMGKSLQPLQEVDQIAYRTFENGIIVLNDGVENKAVTISLPSEFHHKKLIDLYDGKKRVKVVNDHIEVTVPRQGARIYLVMN